MKMLVKRGKSLINKELALRENLKKRKKFKDKYKKKRVNNERTI
tara:strand:+ start:374 stop:505 length:132 start_codon:yes stop_codon:yes gene_type:complete